MAAMAICSSAFLIRLVMYIISLFIKPYEVPNMDLSTQKFLLLQLLQVIKFTYIYAFYVTVRGKQHQKRAGVH